MLTTDAFEGSILGPDLWNVFDDLYLCLKIPNVLILVGYDHNITALISVRILDLTRLRLKQVRIWVGKLTTSHTLELVAAKT